MNPEIQILQKKIENLEFIINQFVKDKYIFQKDVEIMNEKSFKIGKTSKIGLFGATPVSQQDAIASPSGGVTVDAPARAAIDGLRTALINIGITE